MQFIENIRNDIATIQNLFDQDPLGGLAALLVVVGGLIVLFYFVILQKVLPLRIGGGSPLESKQSRMFVLGLATFVILSFVFQNSVILRILIVAPILFIAWIIEIGSDDTEW